MEEKNGINRLAIQKCDNQSLVWINTPYAYAKVLAGQTKLEQDVLLQVSEHIQTGLKLFFEQGRDKSPDVPNPLFVEEDTRLLLEPIRIVFADYGVGHSHYAEIREAVESILNIKLVLPSKNQGDEGYVVMNVFSQGAVNDPRDERSYVDFYINRDVAQVVLDMSLGYVQHPRKIARFSRSVYTTTMYMLLKHHCGARSKCVIPLNEIKKALGLVEQDPATGIITAYLMPQYSRFKMRILDKVKADMEKMAARNEIDFTFDYSEVRPAGKQRGDPTSIEFTLVPSAMGSERKAEIRRTAARSKLIAQLQSRCGDLKETDLMAIVGEVPDAMFKEFSDFAYKQLPRIIEKVYPEDMAGFIKNSLRRWIKDKKAGPVLPGLTATEPKRKAVKKTDDPFRITPGEYAAEYARLKQLCSPAYREWLDQACHAGSQRGGIIIEFADRRTLDAFEAFEQSPANADEVKAFRQLYASVMGRRMTPPDLIRGVKKLIF